MKKKQCTYARTDTVARMQDGVLLCRQMAPVQMARMAWR